MHNKNFLVIIATFWLISLYSAAQIHNLPIKTVNGIECYVYRVQKGEGFYRIGKNFETTEAVIRSLNPQIGESLQEGTELFIPVNKSAKNNPGFILHTVEKRQTIFGICKIYEISQEQLLELNPHLANNTVREGEILKIPIKKEETVADIQKTDNRPALKPEIKEAVSESTARTNQATTVLPKPTRRPDTLKIAFLLPFMLDQKADPSDSRFTEFYAGALIAIRDAKNKGMSFEIYSYDTEKTDVKLMEVLRQNPLDKMDLIIGPVYSSQVSVIGDFARMNRIKTLIPFTSRVIDLDTNPYIFQFNPSQEVEIRKLQEILQGDAANLNIIFADIPNVSSLDDGMVLTQSLKNFLAKNRIQYHSILFGDGYQANLQQVLSKTKENVLFFNTNRVNQAGVYMKDLIPLSASHEFKIYEPYAWRSSKIEKPRSFYLSFFRDEFPEKEYQDYLTSFFELYNWIPNNDFPRYDLLGYDLLSYFINTIVTTEVNGRQLFPVHEGIQSDIQFEKATERGGYINKQLYHFE
jgi:LysM repeat protein